MSLETIQFNIDSENNRHKTILDGLKRQIEQEKTRHKQHIQYLQQQKANAIEDEKKYVTEDYISTPIERLNRQFEIVFNELESIKQTMYQYCC